MFPKLFLTALVFIILLTLFCQSRDLKGTCFYKDIFSGKFLWFFKELRENGCVSNLLTVRVTVGVKDRLFEGYSC